jgi:hypothetical protein
MYSGDFTKNSMFKNANLNGSSVIINQNTDGISQKISIKQNAGLTRSTAENKPSQPDNPATSKIADSQRGSVNMNFGAGITQGKVKVVGNSEVNITVEENSSLEFELPPDAKVTTAKTKKKVSFADPISREYQEKTHISRGTQTSVNDIQNTDDIRQEKTRRPKPQPQFRTNNETIITGKKQRGLLSTENNTTFNRCKIYDDRKWFGDNTVLKSEKAHFTIAEKSEIYGKIHSEKGSVKVEEESYVYGDIISRTGNIACTDNSRVEGEIKTGGGGVFVDNSTVGSIINHFGPVSLNDASVKGDVEIDGRQFSMKSSTIGGTLSLHANNFTLDNNCSINTLNIKVDASYLDTINNVPITQNVILKAGSTLDELISDAKDGILTIEKGAHYYGGAIPNFTIIEDVVDESRLSSN